MHCTSVPNKPDAHVLRITAPRTRRPAGACSAIGPHAAAAAGREGGVMRKARRANGIIMEVYED